MTKRFEGLSKRERMRKLKNMPDSEIDYSDIPELSIEDVQLVKQGSLTTSISIQIDTEMFRSIQAIAREKGDTYQSLIKDILRTYVADYSSQKKEP